MYLQYSCYLLTFSTLHWSSKNNWLITFISSLTKDFLKGFVNWLNKHWDFSKKRGSVYKSCSWWTWWVKWRLETWQWFGQQRAVLGMTPTWSSGLILSENRRGIDALVSFISTFGGTLCATYFPLFYVLNQQKCVCCCVCLATYLVCLTFGGKKGLRKKLQLFMYL